MRKLLLSLALVSSLFAESVEVDLEGFESDALEGFSDFQEDEGSELEGFSDFDEDLSSQAELSQESESSNSYVVSGDLAFKTALTLHKHKVDAQEYQGLSKAQTALYLQFDTKLSDDWKLRVSGDAYYDAIYDLRSYNSATTETYKDQLRFDDSYVEGSLSPALDLKVGRQIVVWGKSDTIRVTDVINPLDNRELGVIDIEDLRLSTTMAKFDNYVGNWNYSVMFIVESRTFLEAEARSEFFPVDELFEGAPTPFLALKRPANSLENMQYAFAANGLFSGWDLSFYAADVYDSKWHLNPLTKKREISKIKMLGSATNIALGSWLLKTEFAFIDGVKYNTTQDDKQRLDVLVGFDYMGLKDSVITLEVADRHIFDYEKEMNRRDGGVSDYLEEDEMQSALHLSRTFMNETLTFNALVTLFGKQLENGGFARIWLDYDVADGVSANLGYVNYIGGEKPFLDALKLNDRLFGDITYSF